MPLRQNTSARFVAIETLCRLEKSRKPVNALFNSVLSEYPLENNDRQLAGNIIYGLLRNRQSLDLMLQHLCSQPLKKLKPFIHQTLRAGLFQILYLDRIPESAAVNESVKAVQAARLPKQLQGFVNGVLRNSIRKRDELLDILNNPEQLITNHPDWLCRRWEKRYGREEMLRICRQNNEQAPLTLQINSSKSDRETLLAKLHQKGITAHVGKYCEDTLILEDFHGAVTGLPGFSEGLFQIQDQGATLLAQLLAPTVAKGEYLDACAGVGGKTSVLAQFTDPVGATLSAVEPDRTRQEKFKENMKRLHPELNIPLFCGSLQEFATSTSSRFHGILLDAPCSGTGVIRRHPDIRWNRREEDFNHYHETQLELLHAAATLLLPEGILVYATCSLEKEENEEVIKYFLRANSNFSLEDCGRFLPPSLITEKFFTPLPDAEIDGFFGAILIKQTDPCQ
ncbi:MAG: 16S rRNA (cytosine(967)-C(5))-methyltransferase RsmB [Desulfocapsa sp.]|nr:16S rRNA (cytosine(967)-C(5))-methyltransferase RsmB [Desulfocapsa sp.]